MEKTPRFTRNNQESLGQSQGEHKETPQTESPQGSTEQTSGTQHNRSLRNPAGNTDTDWIKFSCHRQFRRREANTNTTEETEMTEPQNKSIRVETFK